MVERVFMVFQGFSWAVLTIKQATIVFLWTSIPHHLSVIGYTAMIITSLKRRGVDYG
jgi:hypothetical protein